MFRKVGLYMNQEKAETVRMSSLAASFFFDHHIEAVFLQNEDQDTEGMELIITFGGDGTFLAGARYAVERDIPVLGINMGTVGFLTEEEPDHLSECLHAILEGNYQIEERFLLKVTVPKVSAEYYALNDAVITRGGFARLIRVECTVNGEQFGIFTADGMIAATPTGSTGYSLSAGGPIVHPGMNCVILTPVCAHSLQKAPCIVSESSRITMKLLPERKQTAELQIDGRDCEKLETGDEVIVTGSEKKVRLLRIHPFRFFSLLQCKLIEWGSAH